MRSNNIFEPNNLWNYGKIKLKNNLRLSPFEPNGASILVRNFCKARKLNLRTIYKKRDLW